MCFKKNERETSRHRKQKTVFFNLELVTLFTTVQPKNERKSHKKSLNSHLDRLNLRFELRPLLYGDWGSDDRTRHPTGAAEGLLGADKHVRHVLVLTEEREVEDDLQWLSISGHHDELGNASVQGFSGWKIKITVRTLYLVSCPSSMKNIYHNNTCLNHRTTLFHKGWINIKDPLY